jgi:hypothetical protein
MMLYWMVRLLHKNCISNEVCIVHTILLSVRQLHNKKPTEFWHDTLPYVVRDDFTPV